jgi:pimeloyl-ACP methyl ester carboxylesterase
MPYAHNGDVEIYYETFGTPAAPTLLLINGLGSQCINYRTEWCEQFVAAGFFVVRFDNRDVGLSTIFDLVEPDVMGVVEAMDAGRLPDVPYTLGDMARDALAVLDAAGIERAHAHGVSMGGMIAQTLAIELADRLVTMTSAMSTTGDPDVGKPTREAWAALAAPPASDREGFIERALAGQRAYGSPAWFDAARTAAIAGEAFDRAFHPEGPGRQLMAVRASGSRSAALKGVRVPTLVIHGDADRLVDISGGRRTAEVIPDARFEVIEGMGHDYPPQVWDRWVALVATHAGLT